jgi:hypothetical protein
MRKLGETRRDCRMEMGFRNVNVESATAFFFFSSFSPPPLFLLFLFLFPPYPRKEQLAFAERETRGSTSSPRLAVMLAGTSKRSKF